jgi:hypothetical protein
VVREDELEIVIKAAPADAGESAFAGDADPSISSVIRVHWSAPVKEQRKIVLPNDADIRQIRPMRSDTRQTLLVAMSKARAWMDELSSGSEDIGSIARRDNWSERYVRMVLPLAFVSPRIVTTVLEGTLPEGYGVAQLISDQAVSWTEHERKLGIVPRSL